ncbi:MAG: hypoxanthine phosphoribosyltransferase [Anaerofustis sp.]
MHQDIKEILISQEQLDRRVSELAEVIQKEYHDKKPLVICVLKGAVLFMSDLIKKLDMPLEIDFMSVSSYGGETTSSGVVKIIKDLDITITGRDMIIVEDILDTGLTLDYLIRMLEERKPNSIQVCTLLLKEKDDPDSQMKVPVNYVGFTIKDEFVVGYGLDYNGLYRNLPYIGILKEELYR